MLRRCKQSLIDHGERKRHPATAIGNKLQRRADAEPKDYDKAVSFPTDLHDLVVRRGQTLGFQRDAGDRHYENLRAGMRGLFTELGVAA
jgi:hypothetical protein